MEDSTPGAGRGQTPHRQTGHFLSTDSVTPLIFRLCFLDSVCEVVVNQHCGFRAVLLLQDSARPARPGARTRRTRVKLGKPVPRDNVYFIPEFGAVISCSETTVWPEMFHMIDW